MAECQRRYEHWAAKLAAAARARGKQPRARIRPRARDEAPKPEAVANVTDPEGGGRRPAVMQNVRAGARS